MSVERVLDANFNRAREGLRVVEDIARFHLNAGSVFSSLKHIRLQLGHISSRLNVPGLIDNRDAVRDAGASLTFELESCRQDWNSIIRANFCRVEESLRVLEEILKLVDSNLAIECKGIRFRVYALEKELNEIAGCELDPAVVDADDTPGTFFEPAVANLQRVREARPLIHHITNYVTVNDCANITLMVGALPVMADAIEEVEEMQAISNALVLNLGTLNRETIGSMKAAASAANRLGHPIILDPVGAGATSLRTATAQDILKSFNISVVKGNSSEIGALAGYSASTRGVESGSVDGDIVEAARSLARRYQTIVIVTGAEDIVATDDKFARVYNGHAKMSSITGTGCMCSSILGSFTAVTADYFEASVSALTCYGIAGESAASISPYGSMSFKNSLFDSLENLQPDVVLRRARVTLL